ncbi:hypothetical protein [Microcystis phage Mae-JY30]
MADKPEKPAVQGDQITLEVAGRLLMISAEWVRRLIKAGYIPKTAPGRVPLVGAVQGYIRHLKDEERNKTKTAADSRVRDARAAEIELKIAERRRDLVSREEAEASNAYVVGVINEELNGLAARLTRDVPLRRKYEAEINGAKARIAKALEAAADALETGSELPYSSGGDDT